MWKTYTPTFHKNAITLHQWKIKKKNHAAGGKSPFLNQTGTI